MYSNFLLFKSTLVCERNYKGVAQCPLGAQRIIQGWDAGISVTPGYISLPELNIWDDLTHVCICKQSSICQTKTQEEYMFTRALASPSHH